MLSRLQGWTRSRCFRASLDLIGLGIPIDRARSYAASSTLPAG
jgi:hypothetical protein